MMARFLGGNMFQAMWNNFYNSIIRNASSFTRGAIVTIMVILVAVFLIEAFKKGDEKKPIKNWFAFWCAIIILTLLIIYTILCSL